MTLVGFEAWQLMALAAIVMVAHIVETTLGFGATLIALSLGSFLASLEPWMAVLVALGFVQSGWLAVSGRVHIAWDALARIILPVAAAGLAVGILVRDAAGHEALRKGFGIFVAMLASIEVFRLFRAKAQTPLVAGGLPHLFLGGIIHGLFATGGPLVVYYAGRTLVTRLEFRATLAVLWLILNSVLGAQLALAGRLGFGTLMLALLMLPAAITGIAIGERLKMNEQKFKFATFGLLVLAGVLLAVR